MTMRTNVCFFTSSAEALRPGVLPAVLAAIGCDGTDLVLRTDREERGWEQFCRRISRPTDPGWTTSSKVIRVDDSIQLYEWENLGWSLPLADVPALARLGRCLQVDLLWSHWREADEQFRRLIPETVHGGCIPNSLGLRAGWHDLFECLGEPFGRFFGRASFTVYLWGHGTPADPDAFEQRLVATPCAVELRRRIEAVLGPTSTCVISE
ncbi:MAG TPA: hypothetical protein VD997_01565 [Phycisphaerales bacterium]|nr:hypothetical protein [Phycisphaerales bacterium]